MILTLQRSSYDIAAAITQTSERFLLESAERRRPLRRLPNDAVKTAVL